MTELEKYSIRPAGRHILTIGRDLIQNEIAAVVELVKNAFDADSPNVHISFRALDKGRTFQIVVEDHGHGMSKKTVVGKWLVPSTDDKLRRKRSPKGRLMQGRKGVGRYAAAILGNDLLLETVTDDGIKTSVYVEWEKFERAQFLDDVEIAVKTEKSNAHAGTKLTINGNTNQLMVWSSAQVKNLQHELKKLISPTDFAVAEDEAALPFSISMSLEGLADAYGKEITLQIEPFPIFDLYDYRVSGQISQDGKGLLEFRNQKSKTTVDEAIVFNYERPTQCGSLSIDIRVYDRDKSAIDELIRRGLKDERGNYVGKLQARQILNEANGIGVYRNGFRIRPLGDPDFDWLRLNEQRVQNPSLRIGSNQVIGYVLIESEEQSDLQEKSARDGLRDNVASRNLREIVQLVISELESRRYSYRRKVGLAKSGLKVEAELERIFHFDELKEGVRKRLRNRGIDDATADEIVEIISRDEQEKNKLAEEVKQIVAVYQNHATLGKIINVVLHEARRPLNYFKNQIPNLEFWSGELLSAFREEVLQEILTITDGVKRNAQIFVNLFGRLDPLAAGRRGPKSNVNIKKTIEATAGVFESDLIDNDISFSVKGPDDLIYVCWPQDIFAIFTNLIDNSLFWIREKQPIKRRIEVIIESIEGELIQIDYRDSGPGIEPHLIDSEVIFDPEFSTKPEGHGLGLAISGEAASRNGLSLTALESDSGAYFRLHPKLAKEAEIGPD